MTTHPTGTGHIVAMGGGGFSMEPDNPLLDDYVLSLAPQQPAKVCFVPTASADAESYLVKFYRALANRAVVTDLTLTDRSFVPRQPANSSDLAEFVAAQDIIYVGGGSTANLLALWRAHGLDTILRQAWQQGKIMCGVSAGMLCWFSAGLTDSFGTLAPLHDGLGLIAASACPHYDGESQRRPAYHAALRQGFPSGYAADDGAALHFVGDSLLKAVASRPQARAWQVQCVDGEVIEQALPTTYLGAEQ
ncbi:MAG: peptidase E [Pseudomonadota bacterium]